MLVESPPAFVFFFDATCLVIWLFAEHTSLNSFNFGHFFVIVKKKKKVLFAKKIVSPNYS